MSKIRDTPFWSVTLALFRHRKGLGALESLVEGPLSVVEAWRSSFQVPWQPFFPGVFVAKYLVSVRLTPHCTKSFISSLNCSFQIDRHSQSLFLSPEFFVDVVCESGFVFLLCVLLCLREVHFFFLSPEQASWPQSAPPAFPWCFCLVRIRYPFSLLWSFLSLGIGLR